MPKRYGSKFFGGDLEAVMWVLLLVPFIGLLWVPFYNFYEPALFGFPFFDWYQLAWVPISSVLIWLVCRRRTPDEALEGRASSCPVRSNGLRSRFSFSSSRSSP
jgi:hypothetical protein